MQTYTIIGAQSKQVRLNNAEIQILEHLMAGAELTEQDALQHVISYKREQVLVQTQAGNYQLAELLLRELDEWNDAVAEEFAKAKQQQKEPPKIYIPGRN